MGGVVVLLVVIVLVLWVLASCIRIVPQAYAVVLERLGAYKATWSTGIHFKVPFIERVARRVNLNEQVVDFPPQPVITKDNVTMQIDTVVFFRSQIRSFTHMALRIRSWLSRIFLLQHFVTSSVIWSWMRH